jgi:hypothetical protein
MGTNPSPTLSPNRFTAPNSGGGSDTAVSKLIATQNEARTQFRPSTREGPTYCNAATFCIVRDMGGSLRPLGDAQGQPYAANQMAQNLATSTDYRDVTPEEAQRLANQGNLVIGAWFNPQGHGHVVTVRPDGVTGDEPFGRSGPLLNDIGENDWIARQSGAFKAADKVFYYTPEAGGGH